VSAAFARRVEAVDDTSVGGREYCHRLAAATDAWIAALADDARAAHPRAPRFALVAVGGYGRGELSPQSDIDLLLVHESKSNRIEEVASAVWYPIWDAGLKLGHAVRTLDEHLALAKTDLDVDWGHLRVPFPAFAMVFTDRQTLSSAERLLAADRSSSQEVSSFAHRQLGARARKVRAVPPSQQAAGRSPGSPALLCARRRAEPA
jgi:hypothetical protein